MKITRAWIIAASVVIGCGSSTADSPDGDETPGRGSSSGGGDVNNRPDGGAPGDGATPLPDGPPSVDGSVTPPPPAKGPDNTYCGPGNVPRFGPANDGPAALPTGCFYTAVAATPSPGAETPVPAGADLQAAIDNAKCGDALLLAQGASFDIPGNLTFPAKSCDDQHWITVRTAAPDASLPPEGTRITPCYAGVSSLPGRPSFNCAATTNVMAKIVIHPNQQLSVPGDHYRFIGLEITRPVGGGIVYFLGEMSGSNKIIFDRVWAHGTPTDETNHVFTMANGSYMAVIDSFISDAHCIAGTGTCTDAQAVSGGNNHVDGGIYKVVNNYLEGSGQGMLMGGGSATMVPHDIEVRRNHFFKPMIWMPGAPGFIGTTFIVKNNFELKTGQRILFEGNVLENVWAGFSQVGFQVLLTPKNQAGAGGTNLCPICTVTDVTLRYNQMRHSGAGMQIAAGKSDNGGASLGLFRVSIHDDVLDDISTNYNNAAGSAFQISSSDPVKDIAIRHLTIAALDNKAFSTGGQPMPNVSVDDSIMVNGKYGAWDVGAGPNGCGYQKSGNATALFTACWTPYSFKSDVVIGGNASWPTGTQVPQDATGVGFVNYNGGSGGDYHLSPGSPFKGKASDGKDVGADIDAIDQATAGVATP